MVAIAEGGLAAVAVEPLARRLGVTKGSFYWHFANREALVEAALARWEQAGTMEVIAAVEVVADPRERLRRLIIQAFEDRRGGRLAAALYQAADDPLVAPVLRRVTARRLQYLQDTYAELGMSGDEARRWALDAYTTYMGLHQLLRSGLEDTELDAYSAHLQRILIPQP